MIALLANARFTKLDARGLPVLDASGNAVKVSLPNDPPLERYLAAHAKEIGSIFDAVHHPVLSKAQGGSGEGCDGYEVFDPRDLGSKNQQGGIATRFGTCEDYMHATSALRAEDCESIGDLSLHQSGGENGGPGVFRFLGADGKTLNGRGGMTPQCFRGGTNEDNPIPPFRPQDPVLSPSDDNTFGREKVYKNALPVGYTMTDAYDYVSQLIARLHLSGLRIDDVKGLWPPFVRELVSRFPEVFFYGEDFDGNPSARATFRRLIGHNCSSANFTLHWRLQGACNNYDATQLLPDGAGYQEDEVGFVDNPDTDLSDGEQVISNKGLAYAYAMPLPQRYFLVSGKDYFPSSVWPGAYGLKPLINKIAVFVRTFAIGRYQQRWNDRDVFAYTRDGDGGTLGWSGGCMVAGNFNTLAQRSLSLDSMWPAGTWLWDYSGNIGQVRVGGGGKVNITLPSNAWSRGESFVLLAPADVDTSKRIVRKTTTQTFFGAADLDVMPVRDGMQALPQRIYCARGTGVHATLTLDRTGFDNADASVQLEMVSGPGKTVAWATTGGHATAVATGVTSVEGWHTLRLIGSLLPAAGANFTLQVTYTGAQA